MYSKASDGYIRPKNADGSFQPESYELVIGKGQLDGSPEKSKANGGLNFADVAREIAAPLAQQNFVPSKDPSDTDLLIMVYWGTTVVPNGDHANAVTANRESEALLRANPSQRSDFETSNALTAQKPSTTDVLRSATFQQNPQTPSMPQDVSNFEDAQRARTDSTNAAILGYTHEMAATPTSDPRIDTLKAEIEQRRHYVVLLAYDYETARDHGKPKLLWEAHLSIPEQGNDLGKSLSAMALVASKYFGQNSEGLIQIDLRTGRVEIGEPTSLGTTP